MHHHEGPLGVPLGYLPTSSCNFTITLCFPQDHATFNTPSLPSNGDRSYFPLGFQALLEQDAYHIAGPLS